MRRRIELIIFLAAVILIFLLTHTYVNFFTSPSKNSWPQFVNVAKGAPFRSVAQNLEEAGVVRDAKVLLLMGNILGANKRIQAGEYEFAGGMNMLGVLDMLVKGRVRSYSLTIPEGYNTGEIARMLQDAGLANAKEFQTRAMDNGLAVLLGVEGPTLEGYLYPDTYVFTKGMDVDEVLRKMVERFKSVYTSEVEDIARLKGISMKKAVTLASIIEKETGDPGERGLISAVFHNRLKKRIRLQSDPTVIYAIKGFDGNLTRKHLLTSTPYNTYIHYGLPPGPIASPGRASLIAAVNPAEGDYLYFVSKNDGTHHFSESLTEHNRAVNTYQRRIRPHRPHRPPQSPLPSIRKTPGRRVPAGKS